MSDRYVLRSGSAALERLAILDRVCWPTTRSLVRQAGLRPGMRCLDVGCGAGAVALRMARLVGPAGSVLGIDLDDACLDVARRLAQRHRRPATFERHDVLDFSSAARFDFVYCRFLLSHLVRRDEVIDRLRETIAPGGVFVVEDTDFRGHFSHPPCPAFDRFVALYSETLHRLGGEPNLGAALPNLFRDRGFEVLGVRAVTPVFVTGEEKRLTSQTLTHVRERIEEAGLATSAELDATQRELDAFTADPATLVSASRIVQTWGRPTSAVE